MSPRCRCGAVLPPDLPSIGVQDLFDGSEADLHNCPVCRTTFCGPVRERHDVSRLRLVEEAASAVVVVTMLGAVCALLLGA